MGYWEEETKAQKKRWNGKIITTSRQWLYNDCGSREVSEYSMANVWDVVKDYQSSREWN